ncbi:rhodanese-like domain-containing protein [Leptospira sp. 2 VSF19]|uniref:Rhodanese-like domain-containing protein n=1 Tax=Leptospira soteropolitanensis TaxID=2950025 RepID=A0AAW5VCM4_9LEPT|nr:rhodanese-like domain-containing protein [Leptospira soteropolitanensis]MCW7493066.1 rhodanese-like domain-containing protein [Leptospira soteropolitanensis]MCW7500865.1 rhodanese-like domain-containing protein [Leptospira soteropolitanensis]MCW7522916.1 rhodanese-like domain-containing protein [Leptospira soteropolitanensis]MCW7526977.1 rhodanese-like domain-containing protein [Leptospira soteropolitanensis]MCW7530634.1 rhodanese-like domain-containing protein [Leptospira soteropolitanensi
MKKFLFLLLMIFTIPLLSESSKKKKAKPAPIENKLINYGEFKRIVNRSEGERETHRLTEDQFLKLMEEDGVILLDARSENRFHILHIKGAKNLPFTEFTKESLSEIIPEKKTKILIYCNNNFEGNQEAFAAKSPAASLNLSTYNSLKAYGYESIYELGPLLDVKKTVLPLVSDSPEP